MIIPQDVWETEAIAMRQRSFLRLVTLEQGLHAQGGNFSF